jgi:hypothetical protein
MKPLRSKYLFLILVLLGTAFACSLTSSGSAIRDYGVAGELQGDYWFHVKKPLTLKGLEGRVILLSVWKFT